MIPFYTTGVETRDGQPSAHRQGFERLLPLYLAKIAKRFMGADFLTGGGWNLSETNTEFGPDWLST